MNRMRRRPCSRSRLPGGTWRVRTRYAPKVPPGRRDLRNAVRCAFNVRSSPSPPIGGSVPAQPASLDARLGKQPREGGNPANRFPVATFAHKSVESQPARCAVKDSASAQPFELVVLPVKLLYARSVGRDLTNPWVILGGNEYDLATGRAVVIASPVSALRIGRSISVAFRSAKVARLSRSERRQTVRLFFGRF